MAVEITMPQLSDTMNEGRILTWLKKEGDQVSRGDALAEVATDKADLEIESFHEGTLIKIHAPVGETVKVGSVIALLGEASEVASSGQTASIPTASSTPPSAASPRATPAAAPISVASGAGGSVGGVAGIVQSMINIPPRHGDSERVKASPLARNIAATYGVPVEELQGSGDGGRIVKRDVERALGHEVSVVVPSIQPTPTQGNLAVKEVVYQAPSEIPARPAPVAPRSTQTNTPTSAPSGAGSIEPLSKMRATIAERMSESMSTIPHFYVTTKIKVDTLTKLKNTLKPLPQYEGLTYNHLMVKAVALALRAVPRINASYRDNGVFQPQDINIGIITAVSDGLLIPIVKNADTQSLADIVLDARGLVQRARAGKPKGADLAGGTFSISNMGLFAVDNFTAIINPGQGGILAVSAIQQEPIAADGELRIGEVLRVTLSVDHRIIDGVVAGEFLTELKRLLEDPVLLLA